MAKTIFIAGTDTDVGKTVASAALLVAAKRSGLTTIGLKPIAAGASERGEQLVNEDALMLQQYATLQLPYAQVNPVCFAAPIAPHIAAMDSGTEVMSGPLIGKIRGALMQKHDLAIVEGAGGWAVPLNQRELISTIPRQLNADVVLVVGMRLGCISHALLTAAAIRADGLNLVGWIANNCSSVPMDRFEDNLNTLDRMMGAPRIANIPYLETLDIEQAADAISADWFKR